MPSTYPVNDCHRHTLRCHLLPIMTCDTGARSFRERCAISPAVAGLNWAHSRNTATWDRLHLLPQILCDQSGGGILPVMQRAFGHIRAKPVERGLRIRREAVVGYPL